MAARWKKAPPELVALFDAVLSAEPRAERRAMFGYPAAFVNGNMVTGLHQDDWMVRLAEPDRAELIAMGGRTFEPMPGRPMREYVVLPQAVLRERRALDRVDPPRARLHRRAGAQASDEEASGAQEVAP